MTILLSFLMFMPCTSLHVTAKLHALFQVLPLFCLIPYQYLGNSLSTNNQDVDAVQRWLHHVFSFPLPTWKTILPSFHG